MKSKKNTSNTSNTSNRKTQKGGVFPKNESKSKSKLKSFFSFFKTKKPPTETKPPREKIPQSLVSNYQRSTDAKEGAYAHLGKRQGENTYSHLSFASKSPSSVYSHLKRIPPGEPRDIPPGEPRDNTYNRTMGAYQFPRNLPVPPPVSPQVPFYSPVSNEPNKSAYTQMTLQKIPSLKNLRKQIGTKTINGEEKKSNPLGVVLVLSKKNNKLKYNKTSTGDLINVIQKLLNDKKFTSTQKNELVEQLLNHNTVKNYLQQNKTITINNLKKRISNIYKKPVNNSKNHIYEEVN
jgi:hypothetical protein